MLSPDKKRRRPSVVSDILLLLILLSIKAASINCRMRMCPGVQLPVSLTPPTPIYRLHAARLGHPGGLDGYQKGAQNAAALSHVCVFVCTHLLTTTTTMMCVCVLSPRPWLRWAPTEGRRTRTAPCSRSDKTDAGPFSTAEEHTRRAHITEPPQTNQDARVYTRHPRHGLRWTFLLSRSHNPPHPSANSGASKLPVCVDKFILEVTTCSTFVSSSPRLFL